MTVGAWILLASLLLAAGVGLWRAGTDGRFRGTHRLVGAGSAAAGGSAGATGAPGSLGSASEPTNHPDPLLPADRLGERATLLQFSSAFCAPCRATRRVLAEVAEAVPGVRHVELDAEQHLDLVRRVDVLRTPTTLVLDAAGREVGRAAGAPRKEQVLAALARAVRPDDGQSSHEAGRRHE